MTGADWFLSDNGLRHKRVKQNILTNVTYTFRSPQWFLPREGVKISKLKHVEALFIAKHRIYYEFAGQFLKWSNNYLKGGIHFAT